MKPILLIPLFAVSLAGAQEIDEAALFADTNIVVDSSTIVKSVADAAAAESASVGFSGSVTTAGSVTASRYWFGIDSSGEELRAAQTRFGSLTVGTAMIDARLPGGFKALGSLEVLYAADSGIASFAVPEVFIDANIRHLVYFRAGKQVLQWGRCYFWNPTDLVNVEKKPFIQKIGSREGTYGLKAHVPFGTVVNLYGFAGTRDVTRADSIAGSVKAEVLVKGTEMSLSMWGKQGSKPVYGFDISSRVLDIDVMGEFALHREFRIRRPAVVDGRLGTLDSIVTWAPRLTVGAGKWFKVQGVPDRLMVNAEFYYNYAGSKQDRLDASGIIGSLVSQAPDLDVATVTEFLVTSGFYEPNSFSRYYAALFASFGKFILPDLTLSVNGICNFHQRCGMISGGLDYALLNNFSLGLLLTGYVGPENTEYTFMGDAMQVRLTAGVSF